MYEPSKQKRVNWNLKTINFTQNLMNTIEYEKYKK